MEEGRGRELLVEQRGSFVQTNPDSRDNFYGPDSYLSEFISSIVLCSFFQELIKHYDPGVKIKYSTCLSVCSSWSASAEEGNLRLFSIHFVSMGIFSVALLTAAPNTPTLLC